jgi:cellulose 1,4-beta-cellobiosidase
MKFNGRTVDTKVTIDANWRWVRTKEGYANCYTEAGWDPVVCPDPETCAKNCVIEGITEQQYRTTYGVIAQGNSLQLNLVTGSNIGSRLYVMEPNGRDYFGFDFINREFTFTVDVSKLGCGINAAMYTVHMNLTQPSDLRKAGPAFGMGYGDAQCPMDIKYVNGLPNVETKRKQVCSPEMDIWESNSISNAFTPHPCKNDRIAVCNGDVECGNGPNRHKGICDKDGGDFQYFRQGVTDFYGPGMRVDTKKPMTVITQFITSDGTDNGDLVKIKRFYKQEGKLIPGGELTDEVIAKWKTEWQDPNHFQELGGLKVMGRQMKWKHVLVVSIWGDTSVNMAWLDGTWPKGSTLPGAKRGTCPEGTYEQSIANNRDAFAIFSDFQLGPITTTL